MRTAFALISVLITIKALAQEPDSVGAFSFSGYADVYYAYDFGNPPDHERPNFLYNYKRSNEVNLNLLMAKASYNADRYRANAAIMYGTYAQYNLAAEPGLLKNIYEANIGIKLSKKNNLWLDAGILPSHLGFESAVSADCWTLTRSLAAENSPYYETGLKLSYTSRDEKFTGSLLVLNGWQHIYRPNYMNMPSYGAFVQYKFNSKISFTYTNFVGSDKPDSLNASRVFQDAYFVFDGKKMGVLAGFDLGQERRPDGKFNTWYVPTLITRFMLAKNLKLALRGEYYNDKDQVIIATGTKNGFQTLGTSIGFDYNVAKNILFRVEMKYYNSVDKIFYDNKAMGYQNYCLTTSLAVKF